MKMTTPQKVHWSILVLIEVMANLCLCICRIMHAVPRILDTKSDTIEIHAEPETQKPVPEPAQEPDPDWIQIA